ncbi:MAG TPA: PKD domain-containing protein [Methanoculleus sp.]|nr:PKD domain-containing protein [Methanoculleus sp.]
MGLIRRRIFVLLLVLLLAAPAAAIIPPLDQLPEGSVLLADGTVRLPDGSILLPDPIPTPRPIKTLEDIPSTPGRQTMRLFSDPTQNLMIYWEDSCDSLDDWSYYVTDPHEVNRWAVSPDYKVTDPILNSPNGIGHPYYDKFQSGRLTRVIPFPKSSSPVKAKYLEFWYKYDAPDIGYAGFYVNGVEITDTVEWSPELHPGQWVRVLYPCDHLSGNIEFEVLLQPYTGHPARLMFDQIRVYTDPIVPSFTASPTGGDAPLTVHFTDTTQWSTGNIVGWYWQFGDGATSTQQNPSHTYSYTGNAYDVHLTTTTRWGESNVTNYPAYITVGTVAEGDFTVDFTGTPVNGTSPLVVTFTASVSPAETNITSWKWSFGDGTEGFGQTVSHTYNTYASNAAFDVTLTAFASGSGTANTTTKAGYITVNGSSGSGGGTASLSTVKVRFVILDYVGQRFNNVTVTATPLESTGPWGWIEDLLGVPGKVDVQNEVLTGTTGTDGAIVFTMVESVKYRVDITDPAQGISTSITIYPKEDEIPVYIWPATTPPLGTTVVYDLAATALDDENTRLQLTYSDALDNTTSVWFYIKTENGTLIHSETKTGDANVTLAYEMANVPGEVYIFGFEARHGTYGTIMQDQFIRFESNRPLVDFAPWIPLWVYNWLAIGFIVCIAAIFGFQTLKFGVVLVPVFALLFTFMGWLGTPILITLCALVLGVLLYMRYSEGEGGI